MRPTRTPGAFGNVFPTGAGRYWLNVGGFVWNSETSPALRAHRARQLQAPLVAGSAWREQGFVFTSGIGTPLEPTRLSHEFKALLAKAGRARRRGQEECLGERTDGRVAPPGLLPPDVREAVIQSTVDALLLDLEQYPDMTVGSPSGSDRREDTAC